MDINEQPHIHKPRLNPFAFPSDTDFRFITLIIGVLGASLLIYYFIYATIPINTLAFAGAVQSCTAAAQASFPGSSFADQQAELSFLDRCIAPVQNNEAAWLGLGLALVLTVTVMLYWMLPTWKIWHGQLKVLDTQNTPKDMQAYLSHLCDEAGLKRKPEFLLNPYSTAISGLTFGRFRRYYVVLNSGLVFLFSIDRPAFRAIVLHELGHVRNADIDKTYLSITVGWAFIIAALLPWLIIQFIPPWHFDTTLGIGWRILVLSMVIYLTRKAILRTREIYADVRASVWDEENGETRQAGALRRVINRLPSAGKDHWRYLLRNHPDPKERFRVLNDTTGLFRVGFWDTFAVGIVVASGFTGVSFLSGLLNQELTVSIGPVTEAGWALAFAALAALMVAGIVGSGIWRATFASLRSGVAPRIMQASIALVLGLLSGQLLSISSLANASIPGLPSLLPAQLTLSALVNQAAFFLFWDILLLFVIFLLLRWLRTCTVTWLNVSMSGSSTGWTYWTALMLATIILGIWFVQLSAIQGIVQAILDPSNRMHAAMLDALKTGLGIPFQDINISVILFTLIALTDPLIGLTYFCAWAYPLASWFWRKQQSRTGNAGWIWLDTSSRTQTLALPVQPPLRPGLALLLGLAGGLTFCILLPLFTTVLHLALSSDETMLLAVLLQAGIAGIIAGRVERLGVIHGLFTAFVAGCVMTGGIAMFSLLYNVQADFPSLWGIFLQVVNTGALASLLVSLVVSIIATQLRHIVQPASATRAA